MLSKPAVQCRCDLDWLRVLLILTVLVFYVLHQSVLFVVGFYVLHWAIPDLAK